MDSMEGYLRANNLELKYRIEAETFSGRKFSRVRFAHGLTEKPHVIERIIQLRGVRNGTEQCFEETAFVKVAINSRSVILMRSIAFENDIYSRIMHAGGDERYPIGCQVPHELHARSAGAQKSARRRSFAKYQSLPHSEPARSIQNVPGNVRKGLRR